MKSSFSHQVIRPFTALNQPSESLDRPLSCSSSCSSLDRYKIDRSAVKQEIRNDYDRFKSELHYKAPKIDHSYRVKDVLIIKESKSLTYLEKIQRKARESTADCTKYSVIRDWSLNNGMKIQTGKKITYIDQLQRLKRQIPGPNKYITDSKPKIRGGSKMTASKCSILEAISFEKEAIPAPNKYEPAKGLAQVSKQRNVPRITNKEETTIRVKRRPLVTPAPGIKLDDAKIDFNRPKTAIVKIEKAINKNFIQLNEDRAKKVPGVGQYNTDQSFNKISMTPSLRRARL